MADCSGCKSPRDRANQRYCRACHAAYMRAHRPKHSELEPKARFKANARAYANVYQRRGKLIPQPCERCGVEQSQKHHEDYSKPLAVRWLCRACHLAEHNGPSGIQRFDGARGSCQSEGATVI